MQFDQVLRTFADFFEREGIRYAVAGGAALVAWGHTRPTHDVDFAVDGNERERVIAYAEVLGYETTFASEGYLLSIPGVDRNRVREYFSQHGLLKIYDELEKER